MPTGDCDYWSAPRRKKVWRYPGRPIPRRLQYTYFDPTVKA